MGQISMAKNTFRRSGFRFALAGIALVSLGACTDSVASRTNLANAQYWERSNASSAIYLNGPKAQQMLQRDIAHCVTDVRELERLGSIRPSVPGDVHKPNLIVPDPRAPEGALELEQTPRRDHYLYAEYYDYHDFESCMNNKGWTRLQYLPYDRADQSCLDYLEAISGQQVRSLHDDKDASQPDKQPSTLGDYDRVNH
jgi:hypothetical protein